MSHELFLYSYFEILHIVYFHCYSKVHRVPIYMCEKGYQVTKLILQAEVLLMKGFIIYWWRLKVSRLKGACLRNVVISMKIVIV